MFRCYSKFKTHILFCVLAPIFLLCIATVLIFALANYQVTSNKSESITSNLTLQPSLAMAWGLSFQNGSNIPVPNFSQQALTPYNTYYYDEINNNNIYLTFDCGYENGNTELILDTLKYHNAKASFFVVGTYIDENPELVSRMTDEGHVVGSHSYSHPNMSQSQKSDFTQQLLELEQTYTAITGKPLDKFYRPPEGKFTTENLLWASEMSYKTTLWSLAYTDWKVDEQPSPEYALSKLLPRIHGGAIVLLHNTSSTNAIILDELLTQWKTEGYSFKNLNELGSVK